MSFLGDACGVRGGAGSDDGDVSRRHQPERASVGATIEYFTGIPNQFPLANLGAEPVWGYGTGPSFLPTGLQEGGAYLEQGLLGYTRATMPRRSATISACGPTRPHCWPARRRSDTWESTRWHSVVTWRCC